jgi:hypothetical protein
MRALNDPHLDLKSTRRKTSEGGVTSQGEEN